MAECGPKMTDDGLKWTQMAWNDLQGRGPKHDQKWSITGQFHVLRIICLPTRSQGGTMVFLKRVKRLKVVFFTGLFSRSTSDFAWKKAISFLPCKAPDFFYSGFPPRPRISSPYFVSKKHHPRGSSLPSLNNRGGEVRTPWSLVPAVAIGRCPSFHDQDIGGGQGFFGLWRSNRHHTFITWYHTYVYDICHHAVRRWSRHWGTHGLTGQGVCPPQNVSAVFSPVLLLFWFIIFFHL